MKKLKCRLKMRRLERKKEKNRGKDIVALKIQKISLKAEMCSSEVLPTNRPLSVKSMTRLIGSFTLLDNTFEYLVKPFKTQ